MSSSTTKHVVVLDQYALPRTAAGGTRHVELFGLLESWNAAVLAGDKNLFDQSLVKSEGLLHTVRVTRYSGNGPSRVVNWLSYMASASFAAIRRRRVDAVYASTPQMGSALVGIIVARLKRVPLVLEVRDLWPAILFESGMLMEKSKVYRALKSLERFLYRHSDAIVILAEGSRAPIEADGGDPSSIYFVPNGADVADFVSTQDRAMLRERYRFDGFVIVYAGAHGPANGLDFVLEAAEQLAESLPQAQFILYGSGVDKERLEAAAQQRRLTSIEFRDPVPKTQIAEIFAAADVGLHCLADIELFKYGVSPNKLYDYMASGLPVITNTGGEVAAMVTSADAGIACAPDGIGKAVADLALRSQDQLTALGANGRRFMEQNRSRGAMARRIESILDSVTE